MQVLTHKPSTSWAQVWSSCTNRWTVSLHSTIHKIILPWATSTQQLTEQSESENNTIQLHYRHCCVRVQVHSSVTVTHSNVCTYMYMYICIRTVMYVRIHTYTTTVTTMVAHNWQLTPSNEWEEYRSGCQLQDWNEWTSSATTAIDHIQAVEEGKARSLP